MRKYYFAIITLFFLSEVSVSQDIHMPIMDVNNKIILDLIPESGLVYIHTIQKGHTIYSLAKTFQIKVDDIKVINKISENNILNLGQIVHVPFDIESMNVNGNLDTITNGFYIPVIYQVKAKDNLFRLCKYIFDQPIANMMTRNKVTNYDLSLGQELIVGWLPIESNRRVDQPERIGSVLNTKEKIIDTTGIYTKNELFNPELKVQKPKRILQKHKEVALWDKSSKDNSTMFAMHINAAINSIIEIYNPLQNRTAYATVVGSVPTEVYPEGTNLIISPKVAKALGALDSRFLVEVKYYQ